MSKKLPVVYLARHGETAWSLTGHFMLTTASLSAVGYEHDLSRPVIRLWNDDRHVV